MQIEQLLPREVLTLARSNTADKKRKGVSTALLLTLSEKHQGTELHWETKLGLVSIADAASEREWETTAKALLETLPLERKGTWLHSATMGDPCYLIIRNGKKFYRSTPSYSQFNEPHHFGSSCKASSNPVRVLANHPLLCSTAWTFAMDPSIKLNSVKYANLVLFVLFFFTEKCGQSINLLIGNTCFRIEKGDIIVAGTNGLFDNMWDDEIVGTVIETIESNRHKNSDSYPLGTRTPPHGSAIDFSFSLLFPRAHGGS